MIKPVNLFWNWIALQFKIKEVEEEGGGGGGGVSKEYVDTQDAELQSQITNNATNISSQSHRIDQVISDISDVYENINRIDQELLDIDTNKADKSTTLNGYGITDAYTKTEVDTELDKKLDLVGGNMEGTITSKINTILQRDSDDTQINIYGATNYNKGSYLSLRGKDAPISPGTFTLAAMDGTNTKILEGKPDGSLIWDNKKVETEGVTYLSGNDAFIYNSSQSQGLTITGDYNSNTPRTLLVKDKLCHLNFTLKGNAVNNSANWTSLGQVPEGYRPAHQCTVVGMAYNGTSNEACGGYITTAGMVVVWTNAKVASNNYQIRISVTYDIA